jgi:hypothetical protein
VEPNPPHGAAFAALGPFLLGPLFPGASGRLGVLALGAGDGALHLKYYDGKCENQGV